MDQLAMLFTTGSEVSVEFGVRDEIGPDWIDGGRFFIFRDQGGGSLTGPAIEQIIEWLVIACDLPMKIPGDANILFDGVLLVRTNTLVFEGTWSLCVTYQYPLAWEEDEFIVADLLTMTPHAGRRWPWPAATNTH
jgi:hypothetical protein